MVGDVLRALRTVTWSGVRAATWWLWPPWVADAWLMRGCLADGCWAATTAATSWLWVAVDGWLLMRAADATAIDAFGGTATTRGARAFHLVISVCLFQKFLRVWQISEMFIACPINNLLACTAYDVFLFSPIAMWFCPASVCIKLQDLYFIVSKRLHEFTPGIGTTIIISPRHSGPACKNMNLR